MSNYSEVMGADDGEVQLESVVGMVVEVEAGCGLALAAKSTSRRKNNKSQRAFGERNKNNIK